MSVSRITVFVEPKPENIIAVTKCIGDAGANGVTMLLNRTHGGDVIRFFVDKPAEAFAALEAAEYMVKRDEFIAVAIDDIPGSLARFLHLIKDARIDYDYLQVFPSGKDADCAIVIFDACESAIGETLSSHGFRMLAASELT